MAYLASILRQVDLLLLWIEEQCKLTSSFSFLVDVLTSSLSPSQLLLQLQSLLAHQRQYCSSTVCSSSSSVPSHPRLASFSSCSSPQLTPNLRCRGRDADRTSFPLLEYDAKRTKTLTTLLDLLGSPVMSADEDDGRYFRVVPSSLGERERAKASGKNVEGGKAALIQTARHRQDVKEKKDRRRQTSSSSPCRVLRKETVSPTSSRPQLSSHDCGGAVYRRQRRLLLGLTLILKRAQYFLRVLLFVQELSLCAQQKFWFLLLHGSAGDVRGDSEASSGGEESSLALAHERCGDVARQTKRRKFSKTSELRESTRRKSRRRRHDLILRCLLQKPLYDLLVWRRQTDRRRSRRMTSVRSKDISEEEEEQEEGEGFFLLKEMMHALLLLDDHPSMINSRTRRIFASLPW